MSDTKKTVRVLFVEDSEVDAELVILQLKRASFEPFWERVVTAESLTRALEGGSWDLVLCDNSIPSFTGREALKRVKKLQPGVPVIFFSGLRRDSNRGEEYPDRPDGFLEKGKTAELLELVRKIQAGEQLSSSGDAGRAKNPPLSQPEKSRPKILIVDDQPGNLSALEAALEGLEVDLVRAGSGQEALSKLLDGDYALILLDVRMPEMGGLETAEVLRKRVRTRWVPVIFMTAALDDPREVARGYASGGVDYLAKPFLPEVLRAKVEVFLDLWKKTILLEYQAAELRAANEGLEAFSGSAAHDLRAPLRAIDGFSRILSEDYSGRVLDETGQVFLEKIRQATARMDSLIRDLLVFSHISLQELTLAPADLDPLVDEVLSSLAAEIKGTGATVRVDRPLGKVNAHGLMLRQALENLVTNALKFTAPGQPPEIRIRSEERPGERRRLWVEDRGIGIPKKDQSRLFQAFSRLEAAMPYAGTGLGLAIVKRAVERMGGLIGVESDVGNGSQFFIELVIPPSAKPK